MAYDPCCKARVEAMRAINNQSLAWWDSSFATLMSAATVPSGCCCEARAARAATAVLLNQAPSVMNIRGLSVSRW
jgi:hypothetical protein